MANADKKHFGAGVQQKRSGTGAMTDLPPGGIGENVVLSNRDKSRHSDQRSLDGNSVQTEQLRDHEGNRPEEDAPEQA